MRPAIQEDADGVMALLREAAEWLLERGIQQWQPGQWRGEAIAGAIERGETYLLYLEDRAVATISLQWSDDLMWPDAGEDAGYVHRLAIARSVHGRGIGRYLLTWAERTISNRALRLARLDCVCDNLALRRYYERAGYRHIDDRRVRGRRGDEYCGSCFEKTVL